MIKTKPINSAMQNDCFEHKNNIKQAHKTTYMY